MTDKLDNQLHKILVTNRVMNVCNIVVVFLVLSFGISDGNGARILGIFPPPAPSHYSLGNKLMTELAKRGHEVTFISSYERKKLVTGIRDVVLTGFAENMEETKKQFFNTAAKVNVMSQFSNFIKMSAEMSMNTFNHPNIQTLLSKNEKFDLIIMESFMNEALLGFGYHYKAPTVILSTVGSSIWVNEYVRNPANTAFVPEIISGLPSKMGFFDRVKNTVLSTFLTLFMHLYQYPTQDSILHTHFPDAPHVQELMHNNISMVLLNSHPSYGMAKPSVPNMVEVGGFHVDVPKELPKDLQEYLDSATDGFILFSMGSNLKSTMLPPELRQTLMTTFSKLPYKILWKFEDERMEGKPGNVKIHKWLPQNDILAHPNLKLFITHGGLLSTTEAVYHGVPIVGIPVFGDQISNMGNAERMGLGKTVQFEKLSGQKLLDAVNEVLGNKKYRENMREKSKLLRDQPIKPIDNAMFWIEYSLRHGYVNHLKTSAIHLKWYEIMLLDVYATLAFGIFTVIAVLYISVKKLCCGKKQKQKKYQQEKKNH